MADIDIRLSLKQTKEVVKGLKSINTVLDSIEKSAGLKQVNKDVENLGKTTNKTSGFLQAALGSVSAFAGGFAALSAVRGVTRNFLEFESALTEVKTILPDVAGGTDKLEKSLVNASSQFGTSAAAQAKSFYQIVSAGISDATQANEVLIASNKLAISFSSK